MRIAVVLALLSLSGCVSARMHSETELNTVARGCGLALGELMQDESEKRLLLMMRNEPTVKQRVCVAKWARRNGLKAVFVTMSFPEGAQ